MLLKRNAKRMLARKTLRHKITKKTKKGKETGDKRKRKEQKKTAEKRNNKETSAKESPAEELHASGSCHKDDMQEQFTHQEHSQLPIKPTKVEGQDQGWTKYEQKRWNDDFLDIRHYPEGYFWTRWGHKLWTRAGNRWWTIKFPLRSSDESMEEIEWFSTEAYEDA